MSANDARLAPVFESFWRPAALTPAPFKTHHRPRANPAPARNKDQGESCGSERLGVGVWALATPGRSLAAQQERSGPHHRKQSAYTIDS
jgi:hypothetical protein